MAISRTTMMAVLAMLVVAVAALGTQASANECKDLKTCTECLNDGTKYCGWCHRDVIYKNQTIGTQCVDIRDSWSCPSIFDTAGCTRGYFCNYTTGQCSLAPAGKGMYGNYSSCMEHCYSTPDTYICNTTTYQCVKCEHPNDPGCASKGEACANCHAPPGLFRCDKSDPKNPQCTACHPHDPHKKNCTDFHSACDNCQVPPPPPPPPPPSPPGPTPPTPPPQPQKNYTCNRQKMQCEEAPHGMPQAACDARCSNSTPSSLMGTYRGIQAQTGYQSGEFDFEFGNTTVLIKDNKGNKVHGKVYVLDNLKIKLLDGPNKGKVLTCDMRSVDTGPETTAYALLVSEPDGNLTYSIEDAMRGKNGESVYYLSRCNSWKSKQCDFTPAFQQLRVKATAALRARKAAAPDAAKYTLDAAALADDAADVVAEMAQEGGPSSDLLAPMENDPCNKYLDCSACIAAHEDDLRCGWCLGGQIVYNTTGKSQFMCAGYKAGKAPPFTCTKDFRTEDCSGWSCSWNATNPQCFKSDDGQYPDKQSCQKTCHAAQMARCNNQTKQCEPCTKGPDCKQTMPQCQATCDVPHAKCNLTTHKCVPCDPAHDPDCVDTKGACDEKCRHASTYGICDPSTGQCVPCDPSQHEKGCVSNCNNTCSYGGLYGCNTTDHTCVQGLGTMKLPDCVNDCVPHNHTGNYGCDWSNPDAPVCKKKEGHLKKQDCERNCHAPGFAKCNYTSGQCMKCKPSDPQCRYTKKECDIFCHKSEAQGVFRGIQINEGFKRGEWDFTFFPDGTVAFELQGSNTKYEARFDQHGSASEGTSMVFTVTEVPDDGPLSIHTGDVLSGLFISDEGENHIVKYMYLGLGTDAQAASTFDDAMSAFEWVLTSCQKSAPCDFSSSRLPE